MLPPGADPERSGDAGAAWSAVIVWATMFSVLDNLAHLHVEQENGQVWSPVAGVLDKPYRFRFVPETQPEKVYGHSAMLAFRLLPEEGLRWLIRWPDALKALSMFLAGYRAQSGVVGAIVLQAGRAAIKRRQSHHPRCQKLVLIQLLTITPLSYNRHRRPVNMLKIFPMIYRLLWRMWKEPIFLLNRHCAAFILLVSCLLTGSDNLYSRKNDSQ